MPRLLLENVTKNKHSAVATSVFIFICFDDQRILAADTWVAAQKQR